MGDEVSHRQAQYGAICDYKRSITRKTIGILTKAFLLKTFGQNLVILAWMDPELSCGQTSDWHTDTQTQAVTIPGEKTGLR